MLPTKNQDGGLCICSKMFWVSTPFYKSVVHIFHNSEEQSQIKVLINAFLLQVLSVSFCPSPPLSGTQKMAAIENRPVGRVGLNYQTKKIHLEQPQQMGLVSFQTEWQKQIH